jgi:large subunit ribosomal protein L17
MRHGKRWRKLGRKNDHYDSLSRHLLASLFLHERIITTEEKAKEFKSAAEKMITMAKSPSLHHQRLLISRLHDKEMVTKLLKELAPRYKERSGGYTRIIKLGGSRWEKTKNPGKYAYNRLGDNGKRVIWELVDRKIIEKTPKKIDKTEKGETEAPQEKAAKKKTKVAAAAGPK